MLRCSSFYEDFVKTVLTINTAWSSTCRMAAALVAEPGGGAFPGPEAVLDYGEARLRERAKLGFRAPTVIAATRRMLEDGTIDRAGDGRPDHEYLLALSGIGPYAAAHCRLLLHDFSRIPVDSVVTAYVRERHASDPAAFAASRAAWGAYLALGYRLARLREKLDAAHLSRRRAGGDQAGLRHDIFGTFAVAGEAIWRWPRLPLRPVGATARWGMLQEKTQHLMTDMGALLPLMVSNALNALGAIVILLIGLWLSSKADQIVVRSFSRTPHIDPMLRGFFGSLARYLILTVTVLAVLSEFGIQTTSLVAVLGAAGLAVGLALQGTLSNLAAGIMLLIFRPFKIGHKVQIGANIGTVKELTLFWTELETDDKVQVIVPNGGVWGQPLAQLQHLSRPAACRRGALSDRRGQRSRHRVGTGPRLGRSSIRGCSPIPPQECCSIAALPKTRWRSSVRLPPPRLRRRL